MKYLVQQHGREESRKSSQAEQAPTYPWNEVVPDAPIVQKEQFLTRAELRQEELPRRPYIRLVEDYEPAFKERYLLNPHYMADPHTAAQYAFIAALQEVEHVLRRRSSLSFSYDSEKDIEDAGIIVGALTRIAELSPTSADFQNNIKRISVNSRNRKIPIYRAMAAATEYMHEYPTNSFDPVIFYRAVHGDIQLLEREELVELLLDAYGEDNEMVDIHLGDVLPFERSIMLKNETLPREWESPLVPFEQQIFASLKEEIPRSSPERIPIGIKTDQEVDAKFGYDLAQPFADRFEGEDGLLVDQDSAEESDKRRKRRAIALSVGAFALLSNQAIQGTLEYLWSR